LLHRGLHNTAANTTAIERDRAASHFA